MSGEVVHFEIPADDTARARKFYEKAFGWGMNHMAEFDYTMVQTSPSDQMGMPKAPGMVNGGMGKRGGPLSHPVVTINVDDIEKSLGSIEKAGGKTIQKKQAIGDGSMGYTAYFKDSEGNVMGLYQRGSQ